MKLILRRSQNSLAAWLMAKVMKRHLKTRWMRPVSGFQPRRNSATRSQIQKVDAWYLHSSLPNCPTRRPGREIRTIFTDSSGIISDPMSYNGRKRACGTAKTENRYVESHTRSAIFFRQDSQDLQDQTDLLCPSKKQHPVNFDDPIQWDSLA